MSHPAIGLYELHSIACGLTVADAMVKQSPVTLLEAGPITPGRFAILVTGEVAEVEEAMAAGREKLGAFLADELFLPFAHKSLLPAIYGRHGVKTLDALGVVEVTTVAGCLLAADGAAKEAPVQLIDVRLANGIGGKAFFTVTGDLADVEAAVDRACQLAGDRLYHREVIPLPHGDLDSRIRVVKQKAFG